MGSGPTLEQKWAALTDVTGEVGFVMTDDGRFVEVLFNTDTDALVVDDPENLPGKRIEDVFSAAKADGFQKVIDQAIDAGSEARVEYSLEFEDGLRWFEGMAAPIPSNGAEPSYVLWLARDITERKERSEALEMSRTRYKSLFENNPIVIWEEDFSAVKRELDRLVDEVEDLEAYLSADPDRISALFELVDVIDVNQNALEYYGADSKRELVENLHRLFTAETIDHLIDELLAIANGETRFRTETIARTLDGRLRRELLEMHVPDAHVEDFERVYVTTMDITAQKALEEDLRRKNRRLDEFATIISHDLRNPLTVANGRMELLEAECDSEHLDELRSAVGRMDDIVSGTLRLARAGDVVGEVESIWLPEVLTECWSRTSAPEATLEIADEFAIEGDPDRVRHVFENLFGNAIGHGDDDVTVRVGRLDDGFYVEDDGDGIPADLRDRVFDPGESGAPDGSGFGLAIVRRIVEAHGWDVSVTGGEDGGARFEIRGVGLGSDE